MKLAIRIEGNIHKGYKAYCPALPGCAVVARTQRQARQRLKKAIQGYAENLEEILPRELAREADLQVKHSTFQAA